MFKEKKIEENHPLFENFGKPQDENYLKNNYFSRTVEENDTMKKEVNDNLIFFHYLFFLAIKTEKTRSVPQENYY